MRSDLAPPAFAPFLTYSSRSLEELYLTSNRLKSLALPQPRTQPPPATSASPSPPQLTRLRHLSLSENLLESWATSVDALAAFRDSTFPSLTSMRLSDNPLFRPRSAPTTEATETQPASNADDRHLLHSRLLIIARLPFLTELEGTVISQAERDDAERFWIEQVARGKEEEAALSEWARGRLAELRQSKLKRAPISQSKSLTVRTFAEWPDVAGSLDSSGVNGVAREAKRTLKNRLIRAPRPPPPAELADGVSTLRRTSRPPRPFGPIHYRRHTSRTLRPALSSHTSPSHANLAPDRQATTEKQVPARRSAQARNGRTRRGRRGGQGGDLAGGRGQGGELVGSRGRRRGRSRSTVTRSASDDTFVRNESCSVREQARTNDRNERVKAANGSVSS